MEAGDRSMVSTRISLEDDEYERVKQEAEVYGISVAEFLRRAVRNAIPVRRPLPSSGEKPWMKYAGDVESGDPHSSQHIDDVIDGADDVVYDAKD